MAAVKKVKSVKSQENSVGMVKVHESVIASIVRKATLEIEGVIRLAGSSLVDNLAEIVGSKKIQDRAISVEMNDNSVAVEVRVVLEYGVLIPEVAEAVKESVAAEIVKLTGITDDMLADAPKIAEVIPDFYKFCDGCLLVAHNAPFDSKFVRYYGEEEGYMFEQKVYDTVSIAQSFLYLSNYKLNTLADHYGITFNHHRAADDALATAKIFIEMIKAKKCLPKA